MSYTTFNLLLFNKLLYTFILIVIKKCFKWHGNSKIQIKGIKEVFLLEKIMQMK